MRILSALCLPVALVCCATPAAQVSPSPEPPPPPAAPVSSTPAEPDAGAPVQASAPVPVSTGDAAAPAAHPPKAHAPSIAGHVDASPAKYLEETVVYLASVPGSYKPQTKVMDQRKMQFSPHVLAITAGDSVEFTNHDEVAHNVFSPDGDNYNLGSFAKGESRSHAFPQAGAYTQLCSAHPEMLAFVYATPNPYHAVVDAKGNYAIDHVPPGTYQVAIWNSHLRAPEQSVQVTAGATATADFSLKR